MGCAADHQFAARHLHLDMDVVDVPCLVLAMQQFDRHTATDQVPETVLELFDVIADFGLNLWGGWHSVDGNLERLVHHSSPTSAGICHCSGSLPEESRRCRFKYQKVRAASPPRSTSLVTAASEFARLAAGGEWIRTFGSARDRSTGGVGLLRLYLVRIALRPHV